MARTRRLRDQNWLDYKDQTTDSMPRRTPAGHGIPHWRRAGAPVGRRRVHNAVRSRENKWQREETIWKMSRWLSIYLSSTASTLSCQHSAPIFITRYSNGYKSDTPGFSKLLVAVSQNWVPGSGGTRSDKSRGEKSRREQGRIHMRGTSDHGCNAIYECDHLLTYLLLRPTYMRRRRGRWYRCCRSRWSLDKWRCRCHPAVRPVRSASSRRPARGTGPSRDGSCLRPCTTWPAPADSLWPDTRVADGRPAARGAGARSVTSPGEAALSRTGNSHIAHSSRWNKSCTRRSQTSAAAKLW